MIDVKKEQKTYMWQALLTTMVAYALTMGVTRLLFASEPKSAIGLALMSLFFFLYSIGSNRMYFPLRLKGDAAATTRFFLVKKFLRFLLCMVFVAVYGLLQKSTIVYFACGLLAIYLINMIFESTYYIRLESKINSENDSIKK